MADDSFDEFRFSLMQNFLPVGLAVFDRARKGGAAKVIEAFKESEDPLDVLRSEGEASAKNVRARLDQVSPGLGNPVVSVTVDVKETEFSTDVNSDGKALHDLLQRLELRLDDLYSYLGDDLDDNSAGPVNKEG